jgi:hypothetical protein
MVNKIFSVCVLFTLVVFSIPISIAVVSHNAGQVLFSDGENLQYKFTQGTLGGQWDDVTGGINYADGNVGVGITTPNSHVTGKAFIVKGAAGLGDGRGIIEVHSSGFNQRALLEQVGQITYVGNLGDASMNWINGNDLNVIVGGGKTAITILGANGNVGIGTTTP